MSVSLRIDRVVMDLADASAADRVRPALKKAMELLAERLEGAPFARDSDTLALAMQTLQVAPISADELLGARGAERIAEGLYQEIARNLRRQEEAR